MLDQIQSGRFHGLTHRDLALHPISEKYLFRDQKYPPSLFEAHFKAFDISIAIATQESSMGGIHLTAAGAGAQDKDSALSQALRLLFMKKRKFERPLTGKEQILDRIEDQRLFLQGTSPEMKHEMTAQIQKAISRDVESVASPQVTQTEMIGAWNPEFRVFETKIHELPPLSEGGLERWHS